MLSYGCDDVHQYYGVSPHFLIWVGQCLNKRSRGSTLILNSIITKYIRPICHRNCNLIFRINDDSCFDGILVWARYGPGRLAQRRALHLLFTSCQCLLSVNFVDHFSMGMCSGSPFGLREIDLQNTPL